MILVPADPCPGDITDSEVNVPAGRVNVNDLIGLISK